ncbi:MAG: membrane protein insertion efficiency factor YidD [Puniceicoccales bacterium]|nr:membrane protein insertion efficiency factor YidD [Puniceicoccales bacterium]
MNVCRVVGSGVLRSILRVYAVLSPLKIAFFGPAGQCRFSPCCSAYARQCIGRHGPLRATFLILLRFLRCHPFCRGGHDPVP